MRQQSERNRPDPREEETRPIELVTENGFAILRSWEINKVRQPATGSFNFLVRDPENRVREITVEIAADLVLQLELRTRGRILSGNSYWICCAERHLAIYFSENDDHPPGDRLCVNRLDSEDVMSGIRWRTG